LRNFGKSSKRVSCVLFDLDGVLVDACEWHYKSLNQALYEVTGMTISRDDHESKFNGLPTKVKLEILGVDQEKSEMIWKLKQDYTIETIEKNAEIDPKKIELLQFLKENKVKIACVTNSIRHTAEKMLSSTGQIEYFDRIVTNEDVRRNKPFPDCYDYAIKELNSDPEQTLCVEDSDKGIESANKSLARYLWAVKRFEDVNLRNYLEFIDESSNSDGG
jgi:beta-phosphoglucomutase